VGASGCGCRYDAASGWYRRQLVGLRGWLVGWAAGPAEAHVPAPWAGWLQAVAGSLRRPLLMGAGDARRARSVGGQLLASVERTGPDHYLAAVLTFIVFRGLVPASEASPAPNSPGTSPTTADHRRSACDADPALARCGPRRATPGVGSHGGLSSAWSIPGPDQTDTPLGPHA